MVAVMAVVALAAWQGWIPVKHAAALGVAGVMGLLCAVVLLDAWRAALGLDSFWRHYLEVQLFPSVAAGRHNPVADPFFFVRVLAELYVPVLLAIPMVAYAWRFRGHRSPLALLGGVWMAVIVGGFSIPRQKYGWYITPMLPGAAWFMGAALHGVVPHVVDRHVARVVVACALGWAVASAFYVRPLDGSRAMVQTIRGIPAPPPAPHLVVHNCSELSSWRASHLAAFYWDAALLDCEEAASPTAVEYTFDGITLRPSPR